MTTPTLAPPTSQSAPHCGRDLVRTVKVKSVEPITVRFAPGTYYLAETFVLDPEDSGTEKAPVSYVASPDGPVILSGGVKLEPKWRPYKDGIMQAEIAAPCEGKVPFDQLFVNGRVMPMARYPNYNADARPFNGTAADAISPERVKRWANPVGAYVHALHANEWGDFHYRITGVDDKGNAKLEGGWQNNRRSGMHNTIPLRREHLRGARRPRRMVPRRRQDNCSISTRRGCRSGQGDGRGRRLRHLVEFRGTT